MSEKVRGAPEQRELTAYYRAPDGEPPYLEQNHRAEATQLRELVRWMAQTVHHAHHEGVITECPKATCKAAREAVGELS
jgi:hypothetical protein